MTSQYQRLLNRVTDPILHDALKLFEFRVRSMNLTRKTIDGYAERFGYFSKYLDSRSIGFSDITSTTIREYMLSWLERGLSPHSVNGQLRILRAFMTYLKQEGDRSDDPSYGIPYVKAPKEAKPILSEEDIKKLLLQPNRKTFTGMRNYCIVLVLYDTLIRLNELINIREEDLDINSGVIRIMGKGRKVRHVPMSDNTAKQLLLYIRKFRGNLLGDSVFCSLKGAQMKPRRVQRILSDIGDKVSVHVSPHLLRHTGASHRALAGMPAFLLQRLLGHSTMQMTQQYVHLVDDEKLRDAVRKYGMS